MTIICIQLCLFITLVILKLFLVFDTSGTRISINPRTLIRNETFSECIEYQKTYTLELPQENIEWQNFFSLDYMPFHKPNVTFVTYYILKNVMIGTNYQILYNGTYMQFFGKFEFDVYVPPKMKKFKEAICINHYHTYFFGHLIHDVFPALLMMPRNLMEKLPILVFLWHDLTIEYLHAIGYKADNVVNIYEPEYVFVKRLHTMHNIECNLIGQPMINVIKTLYERYNLNRYPATKYILMNRPKNKVRYIPNFNEYFDLVKSRFNSINWEIMNGHIKGIYNSAVYWTQVKLVFSTIGSGITGSMLFMKENSVCVCVFFSWADSNVISQARAYKLFLVLWRQPEYLHFTSKEIYLNMTQAIKSMELGVSLSYDPQITKSLKLIEENNFVLV